MWAIPTVSAVRCVEPLTATCGQAAERDEVLATAAAQMQTLQTACAQQLEDLDAMHTQVLQHLCLLCWPPCMCVHVYHVSPGLV